MVILGYFFWYFSIKNNSGIFFVFLHKNNLLVFLSSTSQRFSNIGWISSNQTANVLFAIFVFARTNRGKPEPEFSTKNLTVELGFN